MSTRLRAVVLYFFASALVLAAFSARAEPIPVTIFYTTDAHGHIVTNDGTIGLDLISGIVEQTPNALLVDAGDFLQGAPLASMTKGKDVIGLMKQAGYFAAAVGNHEFDFGPEVLMMRKAEAEAEPRPMRMLSANARGRDGELLFPPDATTEVAGVKLCFFGLTTQTTSKSVTPRYIAGISFDSVLETARTEAGRLRASGCEVVVLLSHVGSRLSPYGSSKDLARVPGIDLVIDGHSHLVVDETDNRAAPLVSSGAHGKALGRVDMAYDKTSGKIVSLRNKLILPPEASTFAPDAALNREIAALAERQDKTLARQVGLMAEALEGDKSDIRTRETPLGNLFADALRGAYNSDFALINGGGLRAGLGKGPVTMRDVITILPFRDQAVTVRVSGTELLQVLEFGFGRLPEPSGAFPQVSGMVVTVNPNNDPGRRVLSVTLPGGEPLEPDKEYILATNDYVAKGGDGYPVLAKKPLLRAGKTMQEAALEFFARTGPEGYRPAPAGRIIFQKSAGPSVK